MDINLEPTVLVTGTSGSIGNEVTKYFSAHGYRCVGWDVQGAPNDNLALFTFCDLKNEDEVANAAKDLAASGLRLQHVVAVAGGGDEQELAADDVTSESYETFNRVIARNLNTAFLTIRATVPMLRLGEGDRSITLISSINAHGGFSAPGYSAAKSGLTGLVKALAPSLAKNAIRINTLALGTVRTANLIRLLQSRGLGPDHLDDVGRRLPMGRILEPSDVARASLALAVDMVGMTGTEVVLDNGQLLLR